MSNIVLHIITLHYRGMLMYNKGMTLLKQLNIRIDDDLYSRLQSLADDTYSSVSQVARIAIARYLESLAEAEARKDAGE
jgi:predicted DNA-binding protein